MIKAKIIDKKKDKITLLFDNISSEYMNAFRRTITKDVPSLAIEDVYIYENSSVMFDEYIALRLGLLPIKASLKEQKEGGTVTLLLDKEGPCTVYSKDIKCTNPRIEIVEDNIPIVELGPGQRFRAEMKATLGKGKDHAKFIPGLTGYRNVVDFNAEKCSLCQKCVKLCPLNIIEIKNKKVSLTKEELCTLCGQCRDYCPEKAIKIGIKPDSFVAHLEATQGIELKEIAAKATEILREKVKELGKEVKGI